jgi:hypothetical protein
MIAYRYPMATFHCRYWLFSKPESDPSDRTGLEFPSSSDFQIFLYAPVLFEFCKAKIDD